MNKLLGILQASIKAKVILSVVGIAVLTGGSFGGYSVYKNYQEVTKPVTVSSATNLQDSKTTTNDTTQIAQSTTPTTSDTAQSHDATSNPSNPTAQTSNTQATSTTTKQTSTNQQTSGTQTPTTPTPVKTTTPTLTPSPASNDPRYAPITQYNQLTYGGITAGSQFEQKGTYYKLDGITVGGVYGTGLAANEIELEVDIKNHTVTVFVGAQNEQQYAGDDLYLSLVSSNGQTIFNGSLSKVTSSTGIVKKVISLPTYSAGSAGTWLSPSTYNIKAWTQHEEVNKGTFPVDERGLVKTR